MENSSKNRDPDDKRAVRRCTRFYERKLSPNLTGEQKERLRWRIFNYRMDYCPIGDENPKAQFPELKKYWRGKFVSELELATLQHLLDRELYQPKKDR